MFVSFFSTSSTPIIWADYTNHPDCIYAEDIDFNPETQTPNLIEEDGEYSIDIQDKPLPPESPEEKKARITNLLISTENYEEVDTEWVTFEKSDIWPMIIARFFGGDTNAEMAYLQRWNYLKDIERTDEQEVELELIKGWYEAKEEFKNFILSLQ